MYEKGQGVEQDYRKAVKWYEKVAKQGHAEAKDKLMDLCYKIGDRYYNQLNYKKAVEWYEKAAKQGHAEAQFKLGDML